MQFGQCLAAAEWCLKPRVWALAWGGESLSAPGDSAVLSVCRVKLFKEISLSKESGEGESC